MATVARVGYTPWASTGKTWPSGTVPGNLAVFVRVAAGTSSPPPSDLSRWSLAGRFARSIGGNIWPLAWHYEVWTRTVTSDDLAAPPPSVYGQVTVFSGAQGTGTVRTGIGYVRVQPGGGAISVSYTEKSDGSDLQSGPSWQTPTGVVTQPSFFGPVSSRAAVGWSPSPSGGQAGAIAFWGLSMAVEIVPAVSPAPPTVLSPSDDVEIAASGEVDFEWRHNSVLAGGFQDAYRLRFDSGGGWQYWNESTGTLGPSATINLSSVQRTSIEGSKFTAMLNHGWQVQTRESLDGQWSDWGPLSSFMPVTPPSATITGPSSPVADDLTPTITWTNVTPRGQQTAYRLRVVESLSTATVYDSHVIPGAAVSHTVPVRNWTNGLSYTALLQIQQTGGSWSIVQTHEFTMSWSEPPLPEVDAVAEDRGVRVTVSVGQAGKVYVERIGTDGLWTPVVGSVDVSPSTPLEFVDVFAPYGVPTAYRAKLSKELDGQWLSSDYARSDPVQSRDRRGYLGLAANPTGTWMQVSITSVSGIELAEKSVLTYGLGDDYGRVTYGPTQGQSFQVKMWTETEAEYESLLALLKEQRPLVIRFRPEVEPNASRQWDTGRVMTIARSSPVSTEYAKPDVVRQPQIQARNVSFSFVEQPDVVLDGAVELPDRTPAIRVVGDVVVFG